MKHIKLNYLIVLLAVALASSCHKDKVSPPINKPTSTSKIGIYVLNQGGFNDNDASLTFYNYSTKALTPDLFSAANGGAMLGDVGNDLGIYGSKMYIVVNNSNRVDVVNAKTGVLIKSDSLYQCRSVVFYKGNALITSYNGTVAVMDTSSLTINSSIAVGRDPEQMVIVGSKLYVANSGGLTFGDPDNTVSVVDLGTMTQTKQITVIANPVTITADTLGHVFVVSLGDYSNIKAGITIINDATDAVISESNPNLGYNIPVYQQQGFVYYATKDNKVTKFNAATLKTAAYNFVTDGTVITTVYGISGDPATGEIFVTDAVDYQSDGVLYAFDKNGKKEYQLAVGIDPGRIALLK